jgi:glyoxylase-like metal-dependent hydrolase (beta-lactamase superfamily II)
MTIATVDQRVWTVEELHRRLLARERFQLIDLRAPEEYAAWHIEAPTPGSSTNVAMTAILDAGGRDDPRAALRLWAGQRLPESLDRTVPVALVCAKGITSSLAAEALRDSGWEAYGLQGGMSAWAAHYHFRPIVESDTFSLYQCQRPARGCLGYVIAAQGEAIVVDPLRHAAPYLRFLESRRLRATVIVDTHGHADHLSGGRMLAQATGAPYCLHPYDAIHPVDVLIGDLSFEYLWDGLTLRCGDVRIEVLHVPGHTLGNLALLVDGRFLLSGDSIFIASIARPDLGGHPESWAELHYRSLRRLLALPDETIVLPGHFSAFSESDGAGAFARALGKLRQTNTGLQLAAGDLPAFVDYIRRTLPPAMPAYVEIKRVNAGLITVDPDQADTLETGRNVCALTHC